MEIALGLIETKGLIGAIEAADAMVKSANIKIIGKEKITAGLVTIKIVGDVASVKSAIDAGAAAAQRVSQLISAHVIPRPDDQIESLIYDSNFVTSVNKEVSEKSTVKKSKIENNIDLNEIKKVKQPIDEEENSLFNNIITKKKNISDSDVSLNIKRNKLESKLHSLRKEAFDEINFDIENKKLVTQSDIPSSEELSELNVHKLRHLARSVNNFPIKGRQISKATRTELREYFEKMR